METIHSILLVAKGPSAVRWKKYLTPGRQLAVINNAGDLISAEFDYAFTSDFLCLFRKFHERVKCIVGPECIGNLKDDGLNEDLKHDLSWLQNIPIIRYKEKGCEGQTADFEKRIIDGGICHHHTVTGAMHWLCKYRRPKQIHLLGIDGGRKYAEDLRANPHAWTKIVAEHGEDFLDDWKEYTMNLSKVLTKVYGTQFIWHC